MPFEHPDSDQPGISLHGGPSGTEDILAEKVEEELDRIDLRINGYRDQEIFTSSGTWTNPDDGFKAIYVICVGPGGGGGGASATDAGEVSGSGGGTSGVVAEKLIPAASLGSSVSVVVGTGGSPGSGASNGANGSGATSFGALVSAGPGRGGIHQGPSTPPALSSLPTRETSGTGDLVTPAQPGTQATLLGSTPSARIIGGVGGSGRYGSGGNGARQSTGQAGEGFGAGGGGASNGQNQSSRSGGAGTDGVVIIRYIY